MLFDVNLQFRSEWTAGRVTAIKVATTINAIVVCQYIYSSFVEISSLCAKIYVEISGIKFNLIADQVLPCDLYCNFHRLFLVKVSDFLIN